MPKLKYKQSTHYHRPLNIHHTVANNRTRNTFTKTHETNDSFLLFLFWLIRSWHLMCKYAVAHFLCSLKKGVVPELNVLVTFMIRSQLLSLQRGKGTIISSHHIAHFNHAQLIWGRGHCTLTLCYRQVAKFRAEKWSHCASPKNCSSSNDHTRLTQKASNSP